MLEESGPGGVFLPGIALVLTDRRPHPGGIPSVPCPKRAFKLHTIDELWRVKAAISAWSIATVARRRQGCAGPIASVTGCSTCTLIHCRRTRGTPAYAELRGIAFTYIYALTCM